LSGSREEIETLRDMMRNRAPTPADTWKARARTGFSPTAAGIIDLSERGAQPMTTPDGALHISYNGEIYNYREAARRAGKTRRRVPLDLRHEVILHLYREYGTACFQMLEGMFAIIIVDEARRCAVMARDPVGKKPLYYALLGRTPGHGQRSRRHSRDRDYRKDVSIDGLYSVLAMGGVRAPNSLFRGIYKLEPGSFLVADETFRHRQRRRDTSSSRSSNAPSSSTTRRQRSKRWTICSTAPSRSA
jgi:asparagine synthase (glutamine-hydrolysing)